MTTKEQERKALAKIREIAESLGKDSYVMTAFKGAFELAEENIDNDFACSVEDRIAHAERETDTIRDSYNIAKKEIAELKAEIDAIAKERDSIKKMYDQCSKDRSDGIDQIRSLQFENGELVVQIKDKDDEIIRLKARLYDLLYKQAS